MKPYRIDWGSRSLIMGERTLIMGIVNVTPDSFSDGGQFLDPNAAVSQALRLAEEGADIIDIGGESTRPFSEGVDAQAEIERVIPIIESLRNQIAVPISIDTTKASVARSALTAGAEMINAISALRVDSQMAQVAVDFGVPVVLMHMLGTPKTMQANPHYHDTLGEISAFLADRIEAAVFSGIPKNRLIVDPGIGFGKTLDHNLEIVRHLDQFESLETPVLIGPSRKAFIRRLIKPDSQADIAPDRPEVEIGTQAVISAAVLNGAHIVRVHNVANTRTTLKLVDALKQK